MSPSSLSNVLSMPTPSESPRLATPPPPPSPPPSLPNATTATPSSPALTEPSSPGPVPLGDQSPKSPVTPSRDGAEDPFSPASALAPSWPGRESKLIPACEAFPIADNRVNHEASVVSTSAQGSTLGATLPISDSGDYDETIGTQIWASVHDDESFDAEPLLAAPAATQSAPLRSTQAKRAGHALPSNPFAGAQPTRHSAPVLQATPPRTAIMTPPPQSPQALEANVVASFNPFEQPPSAHAVDFSAKWPAIRAAKTPLPAHPFAAHAQRASFDSAFNPFAQSGSAQSRPQLLSASSLSDIASSRPFSPFELRSAETPQPLKLTPAKTTPPKLPPTRLTPTKLTATKSTPTACFDPAPPSPADAGSINLRRETYPMTVRASAEPQILPSTPGPNNVLQPATAEAAAAGA